MSLVNQAVVTLVMSRKISDEITVVVLHRPNTAFESESLVRRYAVDQVNTSFDNVKAA